MTLLSLLLGLVPSAHAGSLVTAGQGNGAVAAMWGQICTILPYCSVGALAPKLIATKLAEFLLSLTTVIGVCVIIYAGIRIILGGLDESGLSEAKRAIMYALLGIVLSILAMVIIAYVQQVVIPEAVGG